MSFTICGNLLPSARAAILLFCVLSVLGMAGQQISLPLYLATFHQHGGPYFVLWFCSLMFALCFGAFSAVLRYRGGLTPEMLQVKWHAGMAAAGMFDAFNGLLVV